MSIQNGAYSQLRVQKGLIREYTNVQKPLALSFDFNPLTITRTRSVTIRSGNAPGTQGGYDFQNENEVVRASQGVTINAESFSIKILLDATDRMDFGDTTACTEGVQPEIDIIRCMLEPKVQNPGGARTLAALGAGSNRAFSRHIYASVLIFEWGVHTLPVFMTQAQIDLKEFLPNLRPYRAEASLTLQIIESVNPFYPHEIERQYRDAGQTI